jgi:hypothetical protein
MPIKRKGSQLARVKNPAKASRSKMQEAVATFSPLRAFVVQFRSGRKELVGRVEHMASGDAAFFESDHELFQFFNRVLRVSERKRDKND